MKHRLVLLTAAVLLVLLALPLTAADFGGTLDNTTSLYYIGGLTVIQEDKLALWLDLELGKNASLLAQGSYTFSLDRYWLFDLDVLRLNARMLSVLELTAGRFDMSEFSAKVLDHSLDGLQLAINLPWAIISAYGGTSYLHLTPNSTILMSLTDAVDAADAENLLAPPRLIEGVQGLFPELFLRQDLTVSLLFQQDLRPDTELIAAGEETQYAGGLAGGRVSSQYVGLGLSGPIISSLYHSTYAYLETGSTLSYVEDAASATGYIYRYRQIVAGMAGLQLSYYLPAFLRSRIALAAVFSSGDADFSSFLEGNSAGNSSLFVPVSRPTFGLVFSPQLGNLFLTELSYSIVPFATSTALWLRNFQGELKMYNYLRPTVGPISESVLEATSDALYLGTEIDAALNFRPFSDLGLALTLGLFFPNAGLLTGSYAQTQFGGRLEISFSF